MRHGNSVNHLGRTYSHRKAMLSNMANSLILHKRITTTVAKAKELRKYVEPLLTRSKPQNDSTHGRRIVFSYLKDKNVVNELFTNVGVKIAERAGGYTRIIKIGARPGDNAEMALIELVDFNEIYGIKTEVKAKTRRSRRGAGSGVASAAPSVDSAIIEDEAPVVAAETATAFEAHEAEEVTAESTIEDTTHLIEETSTDEQSSNDAPSDGEAPADDTDEVK